MRLPATGTNFLRVSGEVMRSSSSAVFIGRRGRYNSRHARSLPRHLVALRAQAAHRACRKEPRIHLEARKGVGTAPGIPCPQPGRRGAGADRAGRYRARRYRGDRRISRRGLSREAPHWDNPVDRAEVRRLTAWFDIKMNFEVTENLLGQKMMRRYDGHTTPNSQAIRAGHANLPYHLDYIGYLVERRRWLAGDHFS